uniref:Uncharacterized protein n=1 Tax=Sinocyclocheilus anshuiensis TaxID=1608454 RepID=A0A671P1I8_9TELE
MKMHYSTLLGLFILLSALSGCNAGKVLVVPADGSHWINMKVLIVELHSKGHNITMEQSPLYTSITVDTGKHDDDFIVNFLPRLLQIQRQGRSFWNEMALILMNSLKEATHDIVLTDPAFGAGVLLAHRLGLPLVFNVRWTMYGEGHFVVAPSPLSYIPVTGLQLTDKMTFTFQVLCFQCKSKLEKFVQSSGEHGVIIMSLGTVFGQLLSEINNEIAAAFAQLPQKVIWRHTGPKPANLAHGGTNGVQEAIYHGVPIVGLPLAFDQPDNLSRMQAKEKAKIVDIATLDRTVFLEALKEVLHNPSYKQNMQRLSKLHHDQPMKPLDHAVFWIEFVMRNRGAPHLRAQSFRMSWIEYHSIDVILTLMATLFILFFATVYVIRYLFRICIKNKLKHE